jgi:NDP-sugar pyrophosphorylase family protein
MLKSIAKDSKMHIIIPMSGVGQRFIDAGYTDPKPLIKIDGKPIIQHVVELFPGESKFTFICNQHHLDTTNMREVLNDIVPDANIVSIPNHKKGPVFAVSQVFDLIDDDEEVIVNYCDFGTWWDYSDFLEHCRNRKADGAIPAYKGFHPHMLGSTNYAFMRDEKQWMLEIKEKEPFTDNRMNEYASNGTYYFRKGSMVKTYFPLLQQKNINLNGEFYVSLIYNLLVEDGLKVSIYNIEHMLQWGTPQDVEEYNTWSNYFYQCIQAEDFWEIEKGSTTLIPLAGHGSRFRKEGYKDPKPLLDVSGKAMILQANNQLPKSEFNRYVCLKDHIAEYQIDQAIKANQPKALITVIDHVTEGQAITCELGMDGIDDDAPLLIAACDNGMLWNHTAYAQLISNKNIDSIVWTFKGHPSARENPQMYGWVNTEEEGGTIKATGVSVKKAISDHPENDHAIVGTFYFRKASLFREALAELKRKDIRVNNEFYVDSMVGILIDLGYQVAAFEVSAYIGWGTPNDYETFKYWQSYFHKTSNHPYSIEQDVTAAADNINELKQSFYRFSQDYR